MYLDGNKKMMNLVGKGFCTVDLTFIDRELHRLCSRQAVMRRRVGTPGAAVLAQLLNEIASAEKLGMLEPLPHVKLRPAPAARIAVEGACDAAVLLEPDTSPRSRAEDHSFRDAASAQVVAVGVGKKSFNPGGATWPS